MEKNFKIYNDFAQSIVDGSYAIKWYGLIGSSDFT